MENMCLNCKICNGKACGNKIPGPGAKGVGDTAIRNYNKWQEVRVNMDTLVENRGVCTETELFGKKLAAPIFAGPVGAVQMHYGDKYDDLRYNDILVQSCREIGLAAFTGDGMDPKVMESACKAVAKADGYGVPTVKPWNNQMVEEKMDLVKASGSFAVAMDIDAAGLPFLKNFEPPAGSKSVEELKEIIDYGHVPFIVKGVMTVKGALKAKEAGAAAIIVSNHGGRVLDQCPATAEVLPEIVQAVGSSMTILVDGGIRTGVDVFKALAMGADGVLVARPFVNAAYADGAEGVRRYGLKLIEELKDTMQMCGAATIDEIDNTMIRLPK